ncbi:hypothetical protein LCGC14_0980550 [marine sediment metagenome]|uniref:Uncharacterized protein n=1 Tax=marine sediment metagenome TaxID=412755 RepID=A0A0F9QS62_9ZZZZ
MASDAQLREQVSRDMGDFHQSTTTSGGSTDGRTLVDTALIDETPQDFTKRRTFVSLELGPTGSGAFEERRVSRMIEQAGELHFPRDFSAQVPTSRIYEMHTHFRASDKDAAVDQALDLLGGTILYIEADSDITLVTDQFDYDLSALGYFKNELHQVHRISDQDTEVTTEFFDWEVRGTFLHLYTLPTIPSTGIKIRVFGIKKATKTGFNVNTGDVLILAARAAMILYEEAIAEFPEEAQLWAGLHAAMSRKFDERVVRHFKATIHKSEFSEAYKLGDPSDVHWNVP